MVFILKGDGVILQSLEVTETKGIWYVMRGDAVMSDHKTKEDADIEKRKKEYEYNRTLNNQKLGIYPAWG